MPDKLSPKRDDQKMIAPDEARRFVRSQLEDIAVTRKPGESLKGMLGRIARIAGLDFGRTRKLWYGEIENIPWHEAETLRLKAKEQRQLWRDMQRRKDLAVLEMSIKRTREYAAQLKRRETDNRLSDLEDADASQQGKFLFWLGGQDPDLDREGDA